VTQKDVAIYQEWIGSLDGYVNAEIRPQIEGYVLRQTYREGFVVKAGDMLTYDNCVPDDSLVVTQIRKRLDQSDARFVEHSAA
jgi:hypothetical protein